MHDLTPITALGGSEPQVDTIGKLTLTERPDIALASVAARMGHEDAVRGHLADLLGRVPEVGEVVLHDPEAGFWMGPDQWMIGAPIGSHEDLAARLKTRMGDTASITEQTDAWTCFDLQGETVEPAMELLCNIDIRKMRTGDAQRTSIHHLGCFVTRRDPADLVRIIGPRASAGSLLHAIVEAMQSIA